MTRVFRTASGSETDLAASIHSKAFGQDDEAGLVRALSSDPTSRPCLSLLAFEGDQPAGHVLFTSVSIEGAGGPVASILCPLAVLPAFQGKGVGGGLIRDGLDRLRADGCDLVFVLGDPAYYGRFGFTACPVGLDAPFPLSPEYQAGWTCQALAGGAADVRGTVRCADTLNQRKYWID